jgi:hypothetical protein
VNCSTFSGAWEALKYLWSLHAGLWFLFLAIPVVFVWDAWLVNRQANAPDREERLAEERERNKDRDWTNG